MTDISSTDLGLLVIKIQDDNIRASELVRFYDAVVNNVSIRPRLMLINKTMDIPKQQAQHFFECGIRYVFGCVEPPVSQPPVVKAYRPDRESQFGLMLRGTATTGPWKDHFSVKIHTAPARLRNRKQSPKADVLISDTAKNVILTLQALWGPPEPYVK